MSVNQIIASLHEVFLERTCALERTSGFCQRRSRLSACAFVQGLVFGWLSDPDASVSALARAIATAGAPVSPQAVQHRFTCASANLLRQVLEALMQHESQTVFLQPTSLCEDHANVSWLDAFSKIWVRDSTTVTLPTSLHASWPGCGGATGKSAGLKVSVLWEWRSGTLAPVQISPASTHDHRVAFVETGDAPPTGTMHLFDLGYFCVAWMQQLHHAGAFFCCRYKANTHLYTTATLGSSLSVRQHLATLPPTQVQGQWNVWLGKTQRLPCRLIAQRVPPAIAQQRRAKLQASYKRKRRPLSAERLQLCDWNLWLTNAPPDQLTAEQVEVLYRVRWQIERLFRLWKETLHLDQWRSHNPARILCEVYAKLIGALLTQKLTTFCLWHDPARSLVKCAQSIMRQAMALLTHLRCTAALRRTLIALRNACQLAAKTQTRRHKPATFQRIRDAQTS